MKKNRTVQSRHRLQPIEKCVRHTFIALSDTPLRNRKRTFLLYPHALSVFVTGNGTDTIGVDILTPRHI